MLVSSELNPRIFRAEEGVKEVPGAYPEPAMVAYDWPIEASSVLKVGCHPLITPVGMTQNRSVKDNIVYLTQEISTSDTHLV